MPNATAHGITIEYETSGDRADPPSPEANAELLRPTPGTREEAIEVDLARSDPLSL